MLTNTTASARRCRGSSARHGTAAVVATVALGVLTGCTGNSCDSLPGLRGERDAARQQYAELTASGTATAEQTEQGDAAVHVLDRQVYDLEQSCAG